MILKLQRVIITTTTFSSHFSDIFHEKDLARIQTDEYIEKFLIYNGHDEKLSTKQLWECLKWRKEYKTNGKDFFC